MKQKQNLIANDAVLTVATAHTEAGLRESVLFTKRDFDLVELRLDRFLRRRALLARCVPAMRLPVLLTARHPAEGGANNLTDDARCSLLQQFLPWASAVDVELRSVASLRQATEAARRRGLPLVVSYHNFLTTPPLSRLRRIAAEARRAGASVVKIATFLRSARDLSMLLILQATETRRGMATMGMGPLGRVSRLVLAAAGSRLNYGFLDRPQVTGQWPARRLRDLIREVRS